VSTTTTRQTAEERREAVFEVAANEFALKGLHGASTDAIARRAGISQPYLFRLFRTKKELYLETVGRKLEETYRVFERASRGKSGEQALKAMGEAYTELTAADRDRILLMLQCFASSEDDDVRATVRKIWRDLVELVEQRSGAPAEEVSRFFAKGMLLTILMAMKLYEDPTPWGERLLAGSLGEEA
jgi:AcrR family transcriptional regulator